MHDAADHYETFGEDYPDCLAGEIDRRFLAFMKISQDGVRNPDIGWSFRSLVAIPNCLVCCVIAESVDGLIEEPQRSEFFFPKDAEKHFRGFAQ